MTVIKNNKKQKPKRKRKPKKSIITPVKPVQCDSQQKNGNQNVKKADIVKLESQAINHTNKPQITQQKMAVKGDNKPAKGGHRNKMGVKYNEKTTMRKPKSQKKSENNNAQKNSPSKKSKSKKRKWHKPIEWGADLVT